MMTPDGCAGSISPSTERKKGMPKRSATARRLRVHIAEIGEGAGVVGVDELRVPDADQSDVYDCESF